MENMLKTSVLRLQTFKIYRHFTYEINFYLYYRFHNERKN